MHALTDQDSETIKGRGGSFIEDWLYPLAARYRALPDPIRYVMGMAYRSLPKRVRYGREYDRVVEFLRTTEKWPYERLVDLQMRQLRQLVDHAYENVPYYRYLMEERQIAPDDFRCLDDLRRLPTLTKDIVRQQSDRLLAQNVPPARRLAMSTGGSTGVPLGLCYEKGVSRAREWAFMHIQWSRVGWKPGDPSVVLRGWSVPGGFWQYEPIHNRLIMSAYQLNEENIPAYLEKMRRFRPKFIEGYPSNLAIVANYMLKNKLPPIQSVQAILAGSENLFPPQRDLVEKAFGCRTFSWYGQAELVALGGECEESNDLHFFPEYGITELLSETGVPITEAGVMGEIVATGFNNYAMPLIRYRTGDLGVWAAGTCRCGREYPRLQKTLGRKQELVIAKDGSVVTLTGLIFAQHFDAFSLIKQMQLEQTIIGQVTIRIVPDSSYARETGEHEIITKIRDAVGDRMDIEFEYVDDLPRTKSGKHVFLIQNVEIDYYLQ